MQQSSTSNLEPILKPEEVSFWPPQPGWYVVIAILLVLIGYGIYRYIQYKKKNAYRKRALLELKKIREESFKKELVFKLNELLKITALKGFTRIEVAHLSGNQWVNFLENKLPETKFSEAPGSLLASASFITLDKLHVNAEEWNNLLKMSEQWIKKHKSG